jgi:hypothetical protein
MLNVGYCKATLAAKNYITVIACLQPEIRPQNFGLQADYTVLHICRCTVKNLPFCSSADHLS